VVAPLLDEPDHFFGGLPIFRCRDLRELLNVDPVLEAFVALGENLQRDEVADARDRQLDAESQANGLGRPCELGFDPR
jgi:hypothetical protein